jgi:archaellum component FlaG (FlaF/FlaG flagellin family)
VTDAQHDFVLFVLIAITAGAVLGAIVTLTSCGGDAFTTAAAATAAIQDEDVAAVEDVAVPEAASEKPVARVEVEAATAKQDEAEADAKDEELLIVNIPDAAPVEAAITDSCHTVDCKNTCPATTVRCCRTDGMCGCTNFGPTCI